MYKIQADNIEFNVMLTTLKKYPENYIFKKIQYPSTINNTILLDRYNTIYIDINPDNLKEIINFIRGYKLDIKNMTSIFIKNLIFDAILLGFDQLANLLEIKINLKKKPITELSNEVKNTLNNNQKIKLMNDITTQHNNSLNNQLSSSSINIDSDFEDTNSSSSNSIFIKNNNKNNVIYSEFKET